MQKKRISQLRIWLLLAFVLGALPLSPLRAQSLGELVAALPEGTMPFLDQETRDTLLNAKPSQEMGVQAFGSLLVLKVKEHTEQFLSFTTGKVSHELIALPYGRKGILCYITTIEHPFRHSNIVFFDGKGEKIPAEKFFSSRPIDKILLPSASEQDQANLEKLSRYFFFSSRDQVLCLSLVPESATTEEEQELWRSVLRKEPLRLKWHRKQFQLQ